MNSAPVLRPYQQRALDAIFTGWDAGQDAVAISAATGSGKSVVFGGVARQHLASRRPGDGPVVLLAHRKELIDQAAEHFRRAAPSLRIERVIGSPGALGSAKRLKATYAWRAADVLITSPQTLNSAATMRDFPDPSLVITDEMHHYASDMFRKVLTALGCFTGTRLLGVTATPFREDHRKLSDVFPVIVYSIDIGWLITHRLDEHGNEIECRAGEGYLVPPRLRHLTVDGLDLRQLPTSQSSGVVDYREKELAEAMEEVGAFKIVAEAVKSELAERKGVLFCPTVASSKLMAAEMAERGLRCAHLDGTMNTAERTRVITDFRSGHVRWLSNVGIVSEGFDLPDIDTVVLARPTQSRIFFRQAVGRALRPAPGKDHAVILDVVGASDGHSLAGVEALTDAEVPAARDGESLTELLDRAHRERRGVLDRIRAHREQVEARQAAGERIVEQITATAEQFGGELPGLEAFVQRSRDPLRQLTDRCRNGLDLADRSLNALITAVTVNQLRSDEQAMAGYIGFARTAMLPLEQLKLALRQALVVLREEPSSEIARAMITGFVGTVAGSLFGEQDERAEPLAPGEAKGMKPGRGPTAAKPVYPARAGWAMRSSNGHLYSPVHDGGREVSQLAVSVALPGGRFWPVLWTRRDSSMDGITPGPLASEEEAYKTITNYSAEHSSSPGLLNPSSPWRKKAAGERACYTARRLAPGIRLPELEDLTAGFVADAIDFARHNSTVNGLAEVIRRRLAK